MSENLKRLCPKCNKVINYNWKVDYDNAIVNKTKCSNCSTEITQF